MLRPALLCSFATLMLSGCTDDGLIHPTVMGIAAGVASIENPDFDQAGFNQSAARYYGGPSQVAASRPQSSSSSGECTLISRGANGHSAWACDSIQ